MEIQTKTTCTREKNSFEFASIIGNGDGDEHTPERLNALLAANQKIKLEKANYRNEQERFEASLMKSPITTEKAFAYFGAMLGLFPPFAMFAKFYFDSQIHRNPEPGVIAFMVCMNAICLGVGYFSGKIVGKLVSQVEKMSWTKMLLIVPFIGVLWGIMTGGAGGVIVFVIGAFFGAIIASLVGGVAIPAFTIFHRLLKKGDVIEEKLFFPIAMGITCAITAFILGL